MSTALPSLPLDVLPSGDLPIGGRWRPGCGDEFESINPATGTHNRVLRAASPDDVAEAAELADAARRDPSWVNLLPHERAAILHRISAGIADNADRISAIQTADTGKTLAETRALAMSAAGTFRYFASALEVLADELTPPRGDYLTMSVHEPIGVVAAITPWNSPIASDAQKVAPALAAGNAVLLKPASWSPLVALELARICEAAGLPPGLLSVLPGPGRTTGEAILHDRHVGKFTFTGGTSTGRHIAAVAADRLIPASLELGGKSPTIVFDDADWQQALAGVIYGIFSSQGQSCIAGSRLFVQRSIYERFVADLSAATARLRIGMPTEPGVQIGSLVHPDHRTEVEGWIERGVADGGTVAVGGRRPERGELADGAFLEPTILVDVDHDATICHDEIFGPVLVALPFDDEDGLIEMANDSVYGLASGIWTADYRRAWRVGRRLQTGTVWINTYKQFSISTPFGGVKESGIGREKGILGIRQFQQQKSLYWDLSGRPLPWIGSALEGRQGESM